MGAWRTTRLDAEGRRTIFELDLDDDGSVLSIKHVEGQDPVSRVDSYESRDGQFLFTRDTQTRTWGRIVKATSDELVIQAGENAMTFTRPEISS